MKNKIVPAILTLAAAIIGLSVQPARAQDATNSPVVVQLVTNQPPAVVAVAPIHLNSAQTAQAVAGLAGGVASVVTLPPLSLFDGQAHLIRIAIRKDGSSVTTIH
jgi:hypothetical protein